MTRQHTHPSSRVLSKLEPGGPLLGIPEYDEHHQPQLFYPQKAFYPLQRILGKIWLSIHPTLRVSTSSLDLIWAGSTRRGSASGVENGDDSEANVDVTSFDLLT
jgi:hypothetical protein